eukprot:GFUD01014054.1.p1 GENE.GFUD01014054.1~~GFUD01014054.1.p1  ORF type:complete len:412 (+),score=80.35 GFUD01014054.1:171-1406(+)
MNSKNQNSIELDIYEDPEDFEEQINNNQNAAEQTNKENQATSFDNSKENVYESIKVETTPQQQEEDAFTIKISKKCLVLLSIGVLMLLVIIIGTTVALSYSAGKAKQLKEVRETCGDGWFNISSDCFKFVDDACDIGCSWEHSVEICKDLGGKLAEPRTDETMTKIMELAKADRTLKKIYFWIGLTNIDSHEYFVWDSDKTPANFNQSFWSTDEPSYDGAYVHTLQDTLLLNDRHELDLNKPICQKPADNIFGKCEKEWRFRKGQCYKFMTNTCTNGCSWAQAIEICNEVNGNLTEGPDFQFLRNIAKSLKLTTNWWVGFSDLEKEGTYVRKTDGKYVNLTNDFASGEPSSKKEHCLEMKYDSDMKLNDKKCEIKERWERAFQPLCQISFGATIAVNGFTISMSVIVMLTN